MRMQKSLLISWSPLNFFNKLIVGVFDRQSESKYSKDRKSELQVLLSLIKAV